ncbi:MAG: glycosyltransferase family 2 protein [Clostridium sp.]
MKKYKFSLVMATYGRKEEVENFLKSILNQTIDLEKIETIIVDQNDKFNLDEIIAKYEDRLFIKHIKSNRRGLSINRNIGIDNADGEIIAFPDDDCEYLTNTLEVVESYFNIHKSDLLMGRIIERDGSDSLRTWPKKIIEINKSNFYTKCSSVTLFINKRNSIIRFNEELGVGAYFGSCEDANLIYRNCKTKKKVIYEPNIKIYHPHYDSNNNMSIEKIQSYGLGFGAMVKENIDLWMVILFLKAEIFHISKCLLSILKADKRSRSYSAFISRIKGFVEYKK